MLARAWVQAMRPATGGATAGIRRAAPHLWAGGVVGLATLYALAAPYLGYILALGLLIAASAILFGLRPDPRLALVAGFGAILFWALFAGLLGVAMPAGMWPRLWG